MNRVYRYFELIFILTLLLLGLNKFYNETCELAMSTTSSYIEGYEIVDKHIFKESFINYLYKNSNNDYISKIYSYDTKEELNITDLINGDYIEDYNNKIRELIYLKYPKFIGDILSKLDGKNSYIFKDNELIIYFNDYNINTDLILFLKVNYNEIYKYLNFTVNLSSKYKNESGYDYDSNKKSVAFTFDDSPNIGKTNRLISILKDNYATSTFFMVGEKMELNKELVSLVNSSPNEIGSHSYSHQNLNKLDTEKIKEDYLKVNSIYKDITNKELKLFRPPYGINKDTYGNTSVILWSLDTLDWKIRNSDYIVNTVLNNISDGDIVLFHDSYNTTIDVVEKLLPILYKKGYQIVSVSTLAKLKNTTLNNNQVYHSFK